VAISSSGARVNAGRLAQKLKSGSQPPHIILLANRSKKFRIGQSESKYIDAMIDSPISPKTFIECIAKFAKVEAAGLIAKFDRMDLPVDEDLPAESVHVKGASPQKKISARDSKYRELTQNLKLPPLQKPSKELIESEAKFFKERDKKLNIEEMEKERMAFFESFISNKIIISFS
jgi:hypothetical protein